MSTLTTVTQSIQTFPTPDTREKDFEEESDKPQTAEKDVWVFNDPQPLSIHSFFYKS